MGAPEYPWYSTSNANAGNVNVVPSKNNASKKGGCNSHPFTRCRSKDKIHGLRRKQQCAACAKYTCNKDRCRVRTRFKDGKLAYVCRMCLNNYDWISNVDPIPTTAELICPML